MIVRPEESSSAKPPFTIFGLDLYLLAFAGIVGTVVLFGLFWIFFTNWPLHVSCGRASGCGWIDRNARPIGPPIGPLSDPWRLKQADHRTD